MRSAEFERLYAEHAQPLFGFLAYRTGDRALAEDLVADTFERALRARRRFDPRRAAAKTWLYAIALNLLRDQRRRAAIERRVLEREAVLAPSAAAAPGSGRYDHSEQLMARDALRRGLEALSDEEREAIALRYGAELSLPEIARLTRRPLTTVEGRVYRGLRKLREELAED